MSANPLSEPSPEPDSNRRPLPYHATPKPASIRNRLQRTAIRGYGWFRAFTHKTGKKHPPGVPPAFLEDQVFIEGHLCPDCDRECVGEANGLHYCICGIEF